MRVLLLVLGLLSATAWGQDPAPQDRVLNGDAKCTRCHDENDSYPVLAIGATKHGTRADPRTPSCTSCHGASEAHMSHKGGSGAGPRPKPEIGFGKHAKTPIDTRTKACLTCHQGSSRVEWQMSAHARTDVTCSSCHLVHAPRDPVRDRVAQSDTCFTCHKEQRVQVNRPVHHPIPEGKMSCSSCHDVHGGNPKQLTRDSTTETCYTCHMEKRGPFVHSHPPVQEDCSICHQPHGTTIASLLKSRSPFLCQECHDTGTRAAASILAASSAASAARLRASWRGRPPVCRPSTRRRS